MGKEKAWSSSYLTLLFHLAFPTPPSSTAHGAGLLATVKSLAHLCSTAEEDGRETQAGTELRGTKQVSSAWSFYFLCFCKPGGVVTLYRCSPSKAFNYLCICLKSSLLCGAEMRRPGPVPHDTKRARTAPGSPAQWSGLGEAASYPERVGPFPSNEIDSKGAKLLSTPAHPLTAMKAKMEWVIAN